MWQAYFFAPWVMLIVLYLQARALAHQIRRHRQGSQSELVLGIYPSERL